MLNGSFLKFGTAKGILLSMSVLNWVGPTCARKCLTMIVRLVVLWGWAGVGGSISSTMRTTDYHENSHKCDTHRKWQHKIHHSSTPQVCLKRFHYSWNFNCNWNRIVGQQQPYHLTAEFSHNNFTILEHTHPQEEKLLQTWSKVRTVVWLKDRPLRFQPRDQKTKPGKRPTGGLIWIDSHDTAKVLIVYKTRG